MNSIVVSFAERADFYDLEYAAKLGALLPKASAEAFEQILPFNPNDMTNRARLLGHYWKYYNDDAGVPKKLDPALGDARANHILWFIENAPDCVFAGDYYLSCKPETKDANFAKVRNAWETQTKLRPTCVQSKVNFALFLFEHDQKSAAKLLVEVKAIEPTNEWALSLLPLLENSNEKSLPLAVFVDEPPQPESFVEQRLDDTEKMLYHWASKIRIPRSTVEIQEHILDRDHFDIWARLDILRWCGDNMERANCLGFDPKVVQRWYRHALWILRHAPSVSLTDNNSPEFGFGLKLPAEFFAPIRDAFVEAFNQSPDKAKVFRNAFALFRANLGQEEAKLLIFDLKAWKEIDRRTRQTLTRELNWKSPKQTIFEKQIDLDTVSSFTEAVVAAPPIRPSVLSMWADDLDLLRADNNGYGYMHNCIENLEWATEKFGYDLVSVARLIGSYSRRRVFLTDRETKQFQALLQWVIENIPESDFAGCLEVSSGEANINTNMLEDVWLKQVASFPDNTRIAENAAYSLFVCSPTRAKEIVSSIIAREPENIFVLETLHALSNTGIPLKNQVGFRDLEFESSCEERIKNFKPIANLALAAVGDELELFVFSLILCLGIPSETLWSNEQALKFNANDLILRAEILRWCERHVFKRSFLAMYSADIARKRTDQLLWLLENIPHCNLNLFTQYHMSLGVSSHQKIAAKAVKAQRKLYGNTIAKYRAELRRKKNASKES